MTAVSRSIAELRLTGARAFDCMSTMMKTDIRAILFDKDGTVIDFNHTWHPLFLDLMAELTKRGGLDSQTKAELSAALGADEKAYANTSVFGTGTFAEIHHHIIQFIPDLSFDELKGMFRHIFENHDMDAKPIGNAEETLALLRQRGYILGIATADRHSNALVTLEKAGLLSSFDFIGGEDSVEKGKPYPDLMKLFCKQYELTPSQVAMVGDTMRDIEFAKNSGAGQAIFVKSSFDDPEAERISDLILADLNALTEHFPG